jgi:hypothetical protein
MTPEYKTWAGIKTRCCNPNASSYENYGGRGIRVCDRWLYGVGGKSGFECFFEDMHEKPSPKHSIDRIDHDGNYEPGNCRWATRTEQANNTRASLLITVNGRIQTAAEWGRETGVLPSIIAWRAGRRWPPERLLEPAAPPFGERRGVTVAAELLTGRLPGTAKSYPSAVRTQEK